MSSTYPPGGQAPVPPAPPSGDQSNNQRLIIVLLILALLAVIALFGVYLLTDDDEQAAVTTSEPTTTAAPAAGGGGTPAAPSSSEPEAPPSAPCSNDAFLSAVGGQIDGIAVSVSGSTCTTVSGGYAIVTMEPADPTVIADPLLVFLEDTGGTWTVLTYGTGVSCTEAGIPADACADL